MTRLPNQDPDPPKMGEPGPDGMGLTKEIRCRA